MGVNGNFTEVVGVKGNIPADHGFGSAGCLNVFFSSLISLFPFCCSWFYCWFQPRTLSTCHCNITLHVVTRPSHHPEGSNTTATALSRILFLLRSPHEFRLHTKENKFSNIIIHTPNWITKIDTPCWLDWSNSRRKWPKSHEINATLKTSVFVDVTPCRL